LPAEVYAAKLELPLGFDVFETDESLMLLIYP